MEGQQSPLRPASKRSLRDQDLLRLPIFEDAEPGSLGSFTERLAVRDLEPGDILMSEGDDSHFFALIVDGDLRVTRTSTEGERLETSLGAPCVIGELAMLTGRPRTATVSASTSTTALIGGADDFRALLELPGVKDRLQAVVSGRLAENARSVAASLPDGSEVQLHPLRGSDREDFIAAYENLSLKSLENRFFSGGKPARSVIEYLLSLDYVNHFAWMVMDPAAPNHGIAEARYVRLGNRPDTADIAFTVTDPSQGRGIGTLLMGALGATAQVAGISWFSADVRGENQAMQALLKKADAEFGPYQSGVITGIVSVDRAASFVSNDVGQQLRRVASDLVRAAGLAS